MKLSTILGRLIERIKPYLLIWFAGFITCHLLFHGELFPERGRGISIFEFYLEYIVIIFFCLFVGYIFMLVYGFIFAYYTRETEKFRTMALMKRFIKLLERQQGEESKKERGKESKSE